MAFFDARKDSLWPSVWSQKTADGLLKDENGLLLAFLKRQHLTKTASGWPSFMPVSQGRILQYMHMMLLML